MNAEELNAEIERIIRSPNNIQEFAVIASIEENWRMIDKNMPVPRSTGVGEDDCPECFEAIRFIFDKFSSGGERIPFICPHCKAELDCVLEYTGYTSDAHLEEREVE